MAHSRTRLLGTGFAMGTADLVPGVSGGTIALVSGVYDELVEAIARFDATALGHLFGGRWRDLGRYLDLGFLLPLVAGIATAVAVLAGVLHAWLDDPVARPRLFAFFVGLVAASVVLVARRVPWSARAAGFAALGSVVGLAVGFMAPARTPDSAAWALFGGAMAISAMILPGISGSFILLLVGQYDRALSAVAERDLGTIALFGLGAVVGLLVMVRVLRWALHRHRTPTLATLVGFIAGTLPRLWPWDACVECARPDRFLPTPTEALVGISLAIVGAAIVVGLERWGPTDPTR